LSHKITILIGTMTGTAEMVAEDMKEAVEADSDYQVILKPMDDLDAGVFDDDGLFIICTSTYGQGDVPDNARQFLEDLQDKKPDLSAVRFGLFGLGDDTYADTFNHGGLTLEKVLRELGAVRLGEPCFHNASGSQTAEDQGVEWVRGWLNEIKNQEQNT